MIAEDPTKDDPNKLDPSVYRYILKHTKRDQILLLLLTGLTMPLAYAMLELPKMIINQAISGIDIPDTFFGYPVDQVKYLMILCAAFFILILINGGLTYIYSIYRGIIGERMLKRFRFDLYGRLLRFPIPRFKQVSQAEIIPLITAETQPLGVWIGNSFALPVFQGGLLITYLFFIFNQDFWLGLAAVMLYPPQLYIIPKIQARINILDKRRVQAVREFSDKVGEAVSGVSDIHINDTSRYEKSKVTTNLSNIYDIRLGIVKGWFLIKFFNLFLGQLTPFFFYAIGGYFVINGDLSLGALVAVLAAYKDLDTSWKDLLSFYQITENIRVRYGQIIEFFQPGNMLNPALQEEREAGQALKDTTIETKALAYSEDAFVRSLDGVSFEIPPGTHVGLLGQSGSGRSALAQLIARLVKPSDGAIKISDQDIDQLYESDLSNKIAYVDQQSFVFNGTVRDNLFYGLKSKSDGVDESLSDSVLNILQKLDMDQDTLQFGLNREIDPVEQPELSAMVLDVRNQLYQILEQDKYQGLVDTLSAEKYNTNLSVVENLIFGEVQGINTNEELLADPRVAEIFERTGLKETLFRIGLNASTVLVDMLSGVPDDSPMFTQFDFIKADELPAFEELSKLSDETKMSSVSGDDVNRIISLAFKLNVARHRLGLITPEIQQLIVDTHMELRKELGEDNDLIEFYDKGRIAKQLTIQDNILFGRIAYGQANAQQKVLDLIMQVVESSGQTSKIIDIGLDYQVGVAGGKLNSKQRQKLTLARALVKNSDILLVNEATSVFEKEIEEELIANILGLMDDRTVIWVLNNADSIDRFDKLILLEQGKIAAEGSAEEIKDLVKINAES